MIDTIFCGLDVLYHYVKFGEDRTTRASCRCENMVFVCLPAGLPHSGKLQLLFLLTGQKSGFRHKGATRCTDSGHTLRDRRACQSVQRAGNAAPKISKISTFW